MLNNAIRIYSLSLCFVATISATVIACFLAYNCIGFTYPRLTMDAKTYYEWQFDYKEFASIPRVSSITPEQLKAQEMEERHNYDLALKRAMASEKWSRLQKVVSNVISLAIIIIVGFIHWRIAKRNLGAQLSA